MSKKNIIAQNIIALFFRMGITMGITLYSVRLLLDILGVENYGIYTVVAGFVSMMNFLSQSMSIAIQRFYSFALGKGNKNELNHIFSLSILIFLFIAGLIFFLGETVGLWFVKTQLVIPPNSFDAVIWVYHFSIITFSISILRIPYTSILFANEDMKLFSMINIAESILKLGAIIVLPFFKSEYLFFYGLLLLVVAILSFLLNFYLTRQKYSESHFKYYYDKNLLKSMMSFSGWSLFGTLAGIGDNQGNNVLINLFFGPVVNAAREVSVQVQNALLSFSNSVYIAFKPQMIKSYAESNFDYMMELFYFGTKAIFFLNFLVCFPLFINTEYILSLWLVKVTPDMIIFTKLSLVYAVIFALNNPISTIVQATGKIKRYFLVVESVIFLSLPLTYLFFYMGMPAEMTFLVSIFIFAIAHFVRLIILKGLIEFSIREYIIKFIKPAILIIILVSVSSFVTSRMIDLLITNNLLKLFSDTLIALLFIIIMSYFIGLNNDEQKTLSNIIRKYLKFGNQN